MIRHLSVSVLLVTVFVQCDFLPFGVFQDSESFDCYIKAEINGEELELNHVWNAYYDSASVAFWGRYTEGEPSEYGYGYVLSLSNYIRHEDNFFDQIPTTFYPNDQPDLILTDSTPTRIPGMLRITEGVSDFYFSRFEILKDESFLKISLADTLNRVLEGTFELHITPTDENTMSRMPDSLTVITAQFRTKLLPLSEIGSHRYALPCKTEYTPRK